MTSESDAPAASSQADDEDARQRTIDRGRAEIERILAEAREDRTSWRRLYSSPDLGSERHRQHSRRKFWRWPWARRKTPTSLEEVVLADHHLDVQLKAMVARGALGAMFGQLLVADVVFFLYAWLGRDWKVPGEVMLGWLSATVVEVIGVVVVVAGYLFPKDGHRWSRPSAPQFSPSREVPQDPPTPGPSDD
ncbi:hypothetical protein DEJ34_03915 [Curtobacterium sp. MCPF17_050]|uniref:hypothetical protein n=1 Tax=Curtobacterium sp. MCPF17_050 TaxID=2175664 RepID=UPI000D8DCF6A|nr:hypothetical protein [Curtobacterium sp. MCPF17_050]WIB16290.1 hypothetical protein DEJ34_03915 [Curtobacterium sp. MCPF17_050]